MPKGVSRCANLTKHCASPVTTIRRASCRTRPSWPRAWGIARIRQLRSSRLLCMLTVAVRFFPSSPVLFSVCSSSTTSRPSSLRRRLHNEKTSTLFSAGQGPEPDRPPHCSPTFLPPDGASRSRYPFLHRNEPSSSELNGLLGAAEPQLPCLLPVFEHMFLIIAALRMFWWV